MKFFVLSESAPYFVICCEGMPGDNLVPLDSPFLVLFWGQNSSVLVISVHYHNYLLKYALLSKVLFDKIY